MTYAFITTPGGFFEWEIECQRMRAWGDPTLARDLYELGYRVAWALRKP